MGELKHIVLGDGLLGSEIVKTTRWDFISRKKDGIDASNPIEIFNLIPRDTDIIINCIAHTDTYSKERDSHWNLNCRFLNELIGFCNERGVKLIHISTDYIYSHSVSMASETDVPVHCDNWYGYTKLVGDAIVQLRCNDYLIIRCSHKPNPFPYTNAWCDQLGNFDYVNVISELIVKMINLNLCGVYNVGTDVKSIYDLAKKTNDVNPIPSPIHTPKNITMNLNKLKNEI